jgi:hypothetical protein
MTADPFAQLIAETSAAMPDDEDAAARALFGFQARLRTPAEVKAMPAPRYLLDGLIVENTLGLVWGPWGSCKTFLMLTWAGFIGSGSWWLGRAVTQTKVLYVATEGVGGMGSRIEAFHADPSRSRLSRSTPCRARTRGAMTKPKEGTTSGRSPAEATTKGAGQSDEHGTNSHTPKDEWKPNPNPRKPFEPGHTHSLVHGASSPRVIAEKAAEVHQSLLAAAPYLDEPKFLPAVHRYLQATARESLLHGHIARMSTEKGPGAVPSRTWEQATAATRLAAKLATDLGLDPIGHARIRALSAGAQATEHSLADLAERGAAIRLSLVDAEAVTARTTTERHDE